jgi:hypothetical protein
MLQHQCWVRFLRRRGQRQCHRGGTAGTLATDEREAVQQRAKVMLAADWGEEPLLAPDYVRLNGRGYALTEGMTSREAARIVLAEVNGH